jgi:hypothetical protein
MTKTIKPSKSQQKAVYNLAPTFGSGLHCTRTLDDCGTYWLTVEKTPSTNLEKDLAARYGWIAISYLIRRNGKVERTTWDPRTESIIWSYSTRYPKI